MAHGEASQNIRGNYTNTVPGPDRKEFSVAKTTNDDRHFQRTPVSASDHHMLSVAPSLQTIGTGTLVG